MRASAASGVALELCRQPRDGSADAGAREDGQGPRLRPQHQRRVAIRALEAHPLVARGFVQPLLVRHRVVEGAVWQQLPVHQLQLAEQRPGAVPVRPAVEPVPAVEELADLHRLDVALVPAPAIDVFAPVHCVAMLFDVDDGRVELALGTLGRRGQGLRSGGIGVLERIEGQSRLAVLVVEQPHQLLRRVVLVLPRDEALRDQVDLLAVVRRLARRGLVAGPQAQVEDERQAMARRDRPDLVRAVGVERRERKLRRLLDLHVGGHLDAAVAHDQRAALARDRQRDRQGGDHAVRLLGVAVGGEEAAALVDEQLVEPGIEPVGRAAEPLRRRVEDLRERLRPRAAREVNPLRADLPAVADRGVDERVRPLAVGRALRCRDQVADLRLGHREGQHAGAVHLQGAAWARTAGRGRRTHRGGRWTAAAPRGQGPRRIRCGGLPWDVFPVRPSAWSESTGPWGGDLFSASSAALEGC